MSPALAGGFFFLPLAPHGKSKKNFKYPQINFHVQMRSKGTKTAARNKIGGGVQFFFFVNLILKMLFPIMSYALVRTRKSLLTQVNSSTYGKKSNHDHIF